ncbi:MAG: type IV secretion system protein [Steroidobacteraceae bacterium]
MWISPIRVRWPLLAGMLFVPVAHAQFAVIDVGAITQLVVQAHTLADQLSTARDHLAQAQAEFASMTGNRGMERLLSGIQRNYLPPDWAGLQDILRGQGGGYGALASGVTQTVQANAILSTQQLAGLPADARQQIVTARRLAALSQNLAREALATTSSRFAALQQLSDALPAASDQKGVLDLQTRVAAENAMLQNEQTKLQTLYEVVRAEEEANQQQLRERALAGHGVFARRFQPAP